MVSLVNVAWPDGSSSTADVVGGSVTVDASQPVRRTCSLQVPDVSLWEQVVLGGAVLYPYRGIQYVDGSIEVVPLGVFEVRGTSGALDGLQTGTLTAPDRWRRVQRARFYAPQGSIPNATVVSEWARLVRGALPGGSDFADLTLSPTILAATVWPQDRDAAAIDLATSIGAEGFFDVYGIPTLRPVTSPTDPFVWTVDHGRQGVMVGGNRERTDEQTYSAVIVRPSRTDGAVPFEQVVLEDPSLLAAIGPVPRFYSSPAITNVDQALTAATSLLHKAVGVASSLTLSTIVNPALDAGDVIAVNLPDGTAELHVIDALTIPLGEGDPMPITTRKQVLPDEGQ